MLEDEKRRGTLKWVRRALEDRPCAVKASVEMILFVTCDVTAPIRQCPYRLPGRFRSPQVKGMFDNFIYALMS
jgi:hypothetical protein